MKRRQSVRQELKAVKNRLNYTSALLSGILTEAEGSITIPKESFESPKFNGAQIQIGEKEIIIRGRPIEKPAQ